jgi:TolA-binding protein
MRALFRSAALLLAVLLSGCVYYNTFYNAKKDFAQATKVPDLEPGKVNKDLLEKCVTRCEKVVKYHPRDKWADDAVLLMGKCLYYMGEPRNALRKFEELELYYPKGGLVQEAYYWSGLANQALDNTADAIASFKQTQEADPKGKFADKAAYQISNTYYLQKDYENTISASEDFVTKYPKSKSKADVLFIQAQSFFEQEKYREAIACFDEFLKTRSEKEVRFDASLKVGEAYLKLGETQKAMATFLSLRRGAPGPEDDAKLAIRIAEGSRALGKVDEALKQFEEVTVLYPKTEASAEGFYMMGEIYEQEKSDMEKAREYYEKARGEAPYSDFSNKALIRSTSVAKLAEYSQKVKSGDQAGLAEAQFLLAELYYMEFNKVDDALVEYKKVVTDYPQSKFGPKAAYAIAWILENVKKDYAGARDAYGQVITGYPNTEFSSAAEQAIKEIDARGTGQ